MNKVSKITPVVRVIIIFGFISMLGDMVYETARSANSQYLNLLNISATDVVSYLWDLNKIRLIFVLICIVEICALFLYFKINKKIKNS